MVFTIRNRHQRQIGSDRIASDRVASNETDLDCIYARNRCKEKGNAICSHIYPDTYMHLRFGL